ncbi:MAG: archease [Candidatus Glassbacteria bacterium]
MPYEYLDHQADIGISSWGNSLEEALKDGALALFGVMANLDSVEAKSELVITCSAREESLLFVEMLNALVSKASLEGYIFRELSAVSIERTDDGLELTAKARGEELDPARHELGVEVKAATYSGLKYRKEAGKHYFKCLLDI